MSFVYAYLIIGVIFTLSHLLEDLADIQDDLDMLDVIFIFIIFVIFYPFAYYNMWKEGSLWSNKI